MECLKEYVALAVLTLLGMVHHTQAVCSQTIADNCVITFINNAGLFTDIRGYPVPFKDPIAPGDWIPLCTAKEEYKRCIEGFKNDCDTITKLFYEGYADMFDYLCQQGSSDYQNYGPCLGARSNKAFGEMCSAVRDDGLTSSNWCTKYNHYFGCLAKGALTYCDRTMANYQFDVISHRHTVEAATTYRCSVESGPYVCVDNGVAVCLDIFIETSNLNKDINKIPLPFTTNTLDADYDKMCQAFNVLKTCASFDIQCENANVQGTLDGVTEAFGHICGSGKDGYKSHNPCLGTQDNTRGTVACLAAYYDGLDSNNWCTKTTEFLACQHLSGEQHCGVFAADYQEDIQRRLLIKLADDHGCPVHAGGGSQGIFGSLSVTFATVLITLSLVMQ